MNKCFALVVALMVVAMPLAAAEMASGAQIQDAIAGNTVQGSMIESGAYTEFYAADGMIMGDGYDGAWRIEGDSMCFKYGEDPETCWGVAIDGDQVIWIRDGKEEGSGTIVSGNPNNF